MFTSHIFELLLAASLASACARDYDRLQHRHPSNRRHTKRQDTVDFPPVLTEQESVLVNSFDARGIDDWSYYYTHGDHVAGRNQSQAQWTADRWAESGFNAGLVEYYTYLNYPVSHSVQLTYANGSTYTPTLEEDVLPEDPTTSYPNRIPTFHGYSFSGNASAEYVYVGRGSQADFARLRELGIPLQGKIALAKYGGAFRGLKVKNAEANGMVGAILFTDPGDDGNVTEENGYAPYPYGPARQPSSVQRGSVEDLATYPGDPTTPGYPSKRDSPRADKGFVTPGIPSIPISYAEVIPLLASLDGYGVPGAEVNRTGWVGALNVTYSTGPVPNARIDMSNIMEDTYTPIWNAVGVLNGTDPAADAIVIGNHRDAWLIGGAADPNSGSAVMIELSRAFGRLLATGWRPRRTIILCSWDAEEYGLVGSTEWVEEYINWLTDSAVVYLNIDIGASGPNPDTSATPELHEAAMNAMKKVIYPYRGQEGLTLYDVWYNLTEGEVGVLGSGSDYTAFLHKGISSLDMGAGGGPNDPIYHYHSNYDSYYWMANFGDPGFTTHSVMGQYLTLLAYEMANAEIVPYNVATYTEALLEYYEDLEAVIADAGVDIDITPLAEAISVFNSSVASFETLRNQATSLNDSLLQRVINDRLRAFQRGFVSQGGLPGREFYQHVAFAPGVDTGYAPVTFPGITEGILYGNITRARDWVGKTARGIEVAAAILG